MYRLTLILIAVCAITTWSLPSTAAIVPRHTVNLSSHTPEFFRDLLGGRVYIHNRRNAPAAVYYAKDGTYYACWLHSNHRYARSHNNATWKIGTPRRRSNIQHRSYHPKTGEHITRRVLIYFPGTGRLIKEGYNHDTKTWAITRDGWIQESWPRILFDRCPALRLPDNFPINERQNSTDYTNFKRAADPVRNHPGHQLRFPGATGLANSGGAPTPHP